MRKGIKAFVGLAVCVVSFLSCQNQGEKEATIAAPECPPCQVESGNVEAEHKATQSLAELSKCTDALEAAGTTLKSCQGDLTELRSESARKEVQCAQADRSFEDKIALAAKELAEANQRTAKAEAKLAQSAVALTEAEETIKRLKDTPENQLAEFSNQLAAATTAEAAELLDKALDQFLLRNAGNPHAKAAQAIKKVLAPRLKTLRAKAAEEKALQSIAAFRTALADVQDGSTLSIAAVVVVGEMLKKSGLGFDGISALPRAKAADASKDPAAQRGKAMVVKGTVLQISRDDEYYTGLIITMKGYSIDKIYSFYTPGKTDGIYAEKSATFAGVFTQRHEYSTRGGGTNEALVLVGYFAGQGN